MKEINKILIIIQRSNGDVLLGQTLINIIFESYNSPQIDILVNDDTVEVAKLLSNVSYIHQFSYSKKRNNRWNQEKKLLFKLYKKYDLTVNLTASDRSVLYAIIAGKKSISAVERENSKSWWKKILLTSYYYFDTTRHILLNNLEPLNILKISHNNVQQSLNYSEEAFEGIKSKLEKKRISKFIIFHPSAQYNYKIYPKYLRDKLLNYLDSLGVPILITGAHNKIDLSIKQELPSLPNIYNFIGETTLEEYLVLSQLSLAYIGMDTLNMHIAASQNKRIFAIFGPTNLTIWSPWSNDLNIAATVNQPLQTYGNITIFQAALPCVACGKAGCDDNQGRSDCLHIINPKKIFNEINDWYQNV